jgi:hypothetical protein
MSRSRSDDNQTEKLVNVCFGISSDDLEMVDRLRGAYTRSKEFYSRSDIFRAGVFVLRRLPPNYILALVRQANAFKEK